MLTRSRYVAALFIFGCSEAGTPVEEPGPSPGTDGNLASKDPFLEWPVIAGGETSDFGDGEATVCVEGVQTEIDIEAAREVGGVDAELAWLAREQRVPVFFGYCPENPPRPDTFMSLRFEVEQIFRIDDVPFLSEGPACRTRLGYRALLEMRTEDGALVGHFYVVLAGRAGLEGEGAVPQELCVGRAIPDLRNFRGTTRVSADMSRPHWSMMRVSICVNETGTSGDMVSYVEYTDGASPPVHGMIVATWPVSEEATACVDVADDKPNAIVLDDYRGSAADPTIGVQARADADEPGAEVELEVRVDGSTLMNTTLTAGALLDLGLQERGAVVEVDVRNGSGAGEVRANIFARNRLQATEACRGPECLASARYDVAYAPFRSDD